MELKFFRKEQHGATGIEYALIAAGVSLALTAIIFIFGDSLFELFALIRDVLAGVNAQP